jgi:hypothetical protein
MEFMMKERSDDERGQETHGCFVGLECERVNVAFCRSFAFNGDSKAAETYAGYYSSYQTVCCATFIHSLVCTVQ